LHPVHSRILIIHSEQSAFIPKEELKRITGAAEMMRRSRFSAERKRLTPLSIIFKGV